MKLAYVAESAVPSRSANSLHVMKMCQAFADLGHDVTLLVPDYLAMRWSVDDPSPDDGTLFVPDYPYREKNIDGSVHSFYDVRANFDIEKLPLITSGIPGPSRPLGFGLATAYKLLRLAPDLVYGRSLIGCEFSMAVGQPTALEIHVPRPEGGLAGRLLPRFLRNSNLRKLVVISEALRRRYLEDFPFLEGNIVVAHDGSDPILEESLKLDEIRPGGDENTIDVGYVGHLYEGKGMEILSEVVPDCPFADFHIIGGTEEDLAYWERELDQHSNISFYGFQPHSRAMGYLQSVDIAVAPYQRVVNGVGGGTNLAQWMSPLKLFEYMAAGKAIVCSDLPVLREVLTDEETALLVDPDSPCEWVSALRRLSDDESLRQELGDNAKALFEERYTWKQRAERLIAKTC